MTAVIALLAIAAYLAGFVAFARWRYDRTRPYTEPLSCQKWLACGRGKHEKWCYQRKGSIIESATEALVYALLLAVVWPVALAVFGLLWLGRLMVGQRELPAERAARIRRLEREAGIEDQL